MRCWQTITMLFCIDTALQQYYYFHSVDQPVPPPVLLHLFCKTIPGITGTGFLQWDRCLSCHPTISVKTVKARKGTQSTNLNLSSPNTGFLTERALLLLLYMISDSSIIMLYWYPDMEMWWLLTVSDYYIKAYIQTFVMFVFPGTANSCYIL